MALTVNHRHYADRSSTIPTYPNYSSNRTNDLLLPLPSKFSPMDTALSKTRAWFNFLPESSREIVKEERFDCDITEIPCAQANDIDYTIVDSNTHLSYSTEHQSVSKPPRKKSKTRNKQKYDMLTMSASTNSLKDFDRRVSSSPNQTSSTIKQQPFSPPPYHPLTNGFYSHHHHQHHHLHHQRSTPSPDNEQISPSSNNNLAESSLTSSLVPSSVTGEAPGSPDDKRRCAVCNDVASGYHYGVWSCEGCKAFFKRSIQGTNEYICPATNTCTIDKHRRKSCQACRLRRCYEVGMTKGTSRRERKYRKKAVAVCKITSTSSNNSMGNNSEHGLLVTTSLTSSTTAGTSSLSQSNNNTFPSPQIQINKTPSESARIPGTSAEFIATLSQASRLNLPAKADTSRPLDDQYFLQLLAKIFDQELVVLINWAKAMPGYTESLTLDQQVTIIEQSWLDTLILDIIERSLERTDETLHFAPDLIISRNRDLSSPGLGSICTSLFNILQAFKDPRTTHEEFIALKATTLINSVPTTISSTKSFRLLTNQVYQSIQYSCDSNPSVYHDNYIRHFTILLQLPHIKMLSSKLIRFFLDMRANDLLPQADLLLEMLDAQDTFDINNSFLSFNTDMNSLSSCTPSFSQNSTSITTINNNLLETPSLIINNKVRTGYQISNDYNKKQHDDNKTQMIDEANGQINYQTTSSPIIYSSPTSGKRSPSTPPLAFYKHPRTELLPTPPQPQNTIHFSMNNSSY